MQANTQLSHIDSRLQFERERSPKTDLDMEPIEAEDEDYESGPPNYEINTYPADFTLEVLHQKWKSGDIEIPAFQRQFVWKQVQASKLIESFLVGLPVPAVFLYTQRTSQRFLVVDGQQRLRSVFYYFDGYFGEEKNGKREVFHLKGLSDRSPFSGKAFGDLDDADRRRLYNCVLRSFIVQQLDPADDTSIYHIFERLNTGGTLLANQEIRNCLYQGSFNDLLHSLNGLPEWRSIVGRPAPDSRQRDVELILRFFALLAPADYHKPMKDFLSAFMSRNRALDEDRIQMFRQAFETACSNVKSHLGERPFHIRTGLNSAVFDCTMVSFAHHATSIPDDIKQRYDNLVSSPDFGRYISSGTTDEEVIEKRFAMAARLLFGDHEAE